MERIGIAASKMSKGKLIHYNLFVVMISTLFSILIFLVSGFAVILCLFVISLVLKIFFPSEHSQTFFDLTKMSLVALAIMVGVFNIIAVLKNMKCSMHKL